MNISTIISPYFYVRSDKDLQGDAELTITGFLISFCIAQLKQ
ncbi:transporter [Escherichia coli]|nr:transporter [Escherichia coli]EFO3032386.1 transporter [Escherichia coli]RCR01059.1 transporter [Escherichia coli]